jgi:tRNA(Arg) A34 adenosine deaminase TadA
MMMITSDDRKFMKRAIALAEQGMTENAGGPFGCVIVKDGEIVGEGYNRVTSTNDPTAHAEVTAIRDACAKLGTFQLEGCVIYTSCEPCPMCLGAIYWARPKMVYYGCNRYDAAQIGFDDQFIYDELACEMDERQIQIKPLLRDEALFAFQAWTAKQDKTKY